MSGERLEARRLDREHHIRCAQQRLPVSLARTGFHAYREIGCDEPSRLVRYQGDAPLTPWVSESTPIFMG